MIAERIGTLSTCRNIRDTSCCVIRDAASQGGSACYGSRLLSLFNTQSSSELCLILIVEIIAWPYCWKLGKASTVFPVALAEFANKPTFLVHTWANIKLMICIAWMLCRMLADSS